MGRGQALKVALPENTPGIILVHNLSFVINQQLAAGTFLKIPPHKPSMSDDYH